MSRLSLRDRVTLATVLIVAAGLVVLSVVFNVLLSNRLTGDASNVLGSRAAAQLATLDLSHGGVRAVEGLGDTALDRDTWVLAGGRVIERPPLAPGAVSREVVRLAAAGRTAEAIVGTTRLRAAPIHGPGGERRGAVVVGVSLVPYNHTRQIVLVSTAILSVLLLAGTAIAVRLAVRSALRPVAEMTAHAADWSEHDLHRRFHLGEPRDEMTTLAATFDRLLRRIEAVLRHEQRFSAELAHELRTPLTGLRGEAELALLRSDLDDGSRRAFERIVESGARMENVIETLLASARAGGDAVAAQPSDPLPAVRDALAIVENSARAREVDLRLEAPAGQLVVEAEPLVVTRALQPLLENAVRHAASRVTVSLNATPDEVTIAVADDGAGLDGREAESLFSPGVSSTGGAGLGLPLARRLARSCGGEVEAVPAVGGRFELTLPGGRAAAVRTRSSSAETIA